MRSTLLVARLILEMLELSGLVTYANVPVGLIAISVGCFPTLIVASTAFVARFILETVPESAFVT